MLARYFSCARLSLDSLSSFRGVEVEVRVPHFVLRFLRNLLDVLPLGDPCPRYESALESSSSSLFCLLLLFLLFITGIVFSCRPRVSIDPLLQVLSLFMMSLDAQTDLYNCISHGHIVLMAMSACLI